jgi:hypothetical protein
MTKPVPVSPQEEQEICITCGFCCDGTLFNKAVLKPGERGNLPEKIEKRCSKVDDEEFFLLPCTYFSGKCNIYDQKKPIVCSKFRCQLLKKFSAGAITQAQAIQIVANALTLRREIYQLYQAIFQTEFEDSFQNLLFELPKLCQMYKADSLKSKQIDLLILKCGLYDTLLLKTFRPPENFENLLNVSMT